MSQKTLSIGCLCLIAVSVPSLQTQAQPRKFIQEPQAIKIKLVPRGPLRPITNGAHPAYRSYDGTNNNIARQRAEWGATDIPLLRELPADYASSDPKNAMNGTSRPSARKISNVLCDEPVTQFSSRNLSAFVYVWGQFIDHDMTLTPTGNTEYVPVGLPADEPLFTVSIPFFRSEVHDGTGTSKPRQQSNLNTAWIDGSVVYGSDETRATWLRTMRNGKMKTSAGNLLPWNTVTGEQGTAIDPNAPSMSNDEDHTVKTFVAGDIRAGEHPGITGIHIMFVREHNRICDRLIAQGLRNDEEIYQRARKEIGGIIQAITYQEFLPAIGVTLSNYTTYRDNVQPDIANTFATAGYRIGHTMVADELALRDNNCQEVGPGSLELDEVFFNPQFIVDYGTDPFLKGFSTHKQYETDTKINGVLRNFLFGDPTAAVRFGLDLAALNIQRGRDHGLPDYNTVRTFYTGGRITNFSQITSDTDKAAALKSLYGNVNNIDLWIGILAEDRLPGKSVGRTMHAMLKTQFENLRDGDFYFYRNDPFLPPAVRDQIGNTKLSDIIKRNTALTSLQSNVFFINTCPGQTGEGRIASEVLDNESPVTIYPNPAQEVLTVDLTGQGGPSTVRIFSVNGLMVKKVEATSNDIQLSIDISELKTGLYLINIKNEKQIKTVKFVKF